MQREIAEQRRRSAAARSRAACAEQRPDLGEQWRRRARRIGQRSEISKPFSKRLILADVRIADSRGPSVANDPMSMHSAIQSHWSK
eukprot:609755-Pyramimonas_sp.AAC.1